MVKTNMSLRIESDLKNDVSALFKSLGMDLRIVTGPSGELQARFRLRVLDSLSGGGDTLGNRKDFLSCKG